MTLVLLSVPPVKLIAVGVEGGTTTVVLLLPKIPLLMTVPPEMLIAELDPVPDQKAPALFVVSDPDVMLN